MGYRSVRRARLFFRSLVEEARAVPAKTFVDVVTGAPIAFLAFPPYREWVLAFQHPGASFLTGKAALTLLISVRVLYTAWRRGHLRQVIAKDVTASLRSLLAAIEGSRPLGNGTAKPAQLTDTAMQNAVQVLLSAVADQTRRVLRVPDSVAVHANLMLPMEVRVHEGDQEVTRAGCGIVCYDKIPATPSWTRLTLGDYGAGEVFNTGKVEVVEDTRDPHWRDLLIKSRSRCFASFPLRSPATNKVIAVVNVDATRPMVLNKSNAVWLYEDALAPHLALFADLLHAYQTLGPAPATPEGDQR